MSECEALRVEFWPWEQSLAYAVWRGDCYLCAFETEAEARAYAELRAKGPKLIASYPADQGVF